MAPTKSFSKSLKGITDDFIVDLSGLSFDSPVEVVYNPLEYARKAYDKYTSQCASVKADVMLLGMNPGPWGMAQTGVPFGEVEAVRDWLGIKTTIGRPKVEHPKRLIQGFNCHRREVSGARLWGWARDTFETPSKFFRRFFVGNYCPLVFLEDSGRNRTPDKLPKAERTPLFAACDRALQRTVEQLSPTWVIGVGAFATRRAESALTDAGVQIGGILHPSPASPLANRGWATQIDKQFKALGIRLP